MEPREENTFMSIIKKQVLRLNYPDNRPNFSSWPVIVSFSIAVHSFAFFLGPHHFALPDILCVSWPHCWLLFLWRSFLQEHLQLLIALVERNLNKKVGQVLLRWGKGLLVERWVIMWKLYNSIPQTPTPILALWQCCLFEKEEQFDLNSY